MAEGTKTYNGLAVPLFGESEIQQQTLATDILTLTGASSQTGDFIVCQNSSGTENFVVDKDGDVSLGGKIEKMVLGTVALATLASDASATVALSGLATNQSVMIFPRAAATTNAQPIVWVAGANSLGYGAGGTACAAMTVNVWAFATA
jgi:hypothetical protein